MTILWSFSYNSSEKLHGKKFGSHNMTVLYPCYNKVCYKGTALCMKLYGTALCMELYGTALCMELYGTALCMELYGTQHHSGLSCRPYTKVVPLWLFVSPFTFRMASLLHLTLCMLDNFPCFCCRFAYLFQN